MNDVLNQQLNTDISELFGFEEMAEEERLDLLENIGSTITESSALRFVAEMPEERSIAFEQFLNEHGEEADVLVKLLEAFPEFETILGEEITAFKKEAQELLG